jgi:hypothetical protein
MEWKVTQYISMCNKFHGTFKFCSIVQIWEKQKVWTRPTSSGRVSRYSNDGSINRYNRTTFLICSALSDVNHLTVATWLNRRGQFRAAKKLLRPGNQRPLFLQVTPEKSLLGVNIIGWLRHQSFPLDYDPPPTSSPMPVVNAKEYRPRRCLIRTTKSGLGRMNERDPSTVATRGVVKWLMLFEISEFLWSSEHSSV